MPVVNFAHTVRLLLLDESRERHNINLDYLHMIDGDLGHIDFGHTGQLEISLNFGFFVEEFNEKAPQVLQSIKEVLGGHLMNLFQDTNLKFYAHDQFIQPNTFTRWSPDLLLGEFTDPKGAKNLRVTNTPIGEILKNRNFSDNVMLDEEIKKAITNIYNRFHQLEQLGQNGLTKNDVSIRFYFKGFGWYTDLDSLKKSNPGRAEYPVTRIEVELSDKSLGGIDFNAQRMSWKEEGQAVEYNTDAAQIQNIPSNTRGIRYEIMSVLPIANFNKLLGLGIGG